MGNQLDEETTYQLDVQTGKAFEAKWTGYTYYSAGTVVTSKTWKFTYNADGHVTAVSEFTSESVDLDEAIPMIYAKAQFDLPLTGFSLGLEGNAINYEDNRLTDYSAKLQYMFDSVLDVGLEVGYREMSLEIDEDVTADVQLKGPYAALLFHF